MTDKEAIKYLQQLYPNGGHCWVDEQRIEAIGMAIQALQEDPVSKEIGDYDHKTVMEALHPELKEEPVSEDLEEAAWLYADKKACLDNAVFTPNELEKERTRLSFDWHDIRETFKAGAKWQKAKMMAKAIDGEVGYWNLRGLSVNVELPHSVEEGDKVKVVVIKED